MKNKIIKTLFIICGLLLIIPSIIYLIQNQTVMGFDTYFNFFINENADKTISTLVYITIYIAIMFVYINIIRQNEIFKNINQILKYVFLVSVIFVVMLPWTSSDIFYYMGVGELDSQYGQNPYYITMKDYYDVYMIFIL